MGPKREPKWSLKASQDGAKKEKKHEVKLRKEWRLRSGKFLLVRWGREGETRAA